MLTGKIIIGAALACLLAALSPAQAAPRYAVTALPSGTNPTGINAAGHIVGDYWNGSAQRGFVWSNGSLVEMGTLGGPDSTGAAINASGQVAGAAGIDGGDSRAFLYAGGAMSDLNVMGGRTSFGRAINNDGHVAGAYYTGDGGTGAFVYRNGSSIDIGTLGGSFTIASGINSAGHVVGMSQVDDDETYLAHAFVYRDGVMTDLGTMQGASLSEATAINDQGQIAGHGWVFGSHHAFIHENGVMRDLGTLGGRRSFAYAINNLGQVVGNSNDIEDFDYFAYLYDGGVMTDLNSLIDPALGWTLHAATGINDHGQIAAYGCRDGQCNGLLLDLVSSVPEPGSALLLLAGLGVFGLRGWRRASAACRRG